MVMAVTLHNIPEGMAVGVVYACFLSGNTKITAADVYKRQLRHKLFHNINKALLGYTFAEAIVAYVVILTENASE